MANIFFMYFKNLKYTAKQVLHRIKFVFSTITHGQLLDAPHRAHCPGPGG